MKKIFIGLIIFTSLNVYPQWVDNNRIKDVVLGSSTAPIEVIEYYSFNCAHCAEFSEKSFAKIKKKYIDSGKVRWIIRDVPIDQMSLQASIIARLATEKQYFDLKKILLTRQEEWAKQKDKEEFLLNIIKIGGIKISDISNSLNDKSLQDSIIKRWYTAKKKYNLMGTPAYIIDGEIHNYLIDFEMFEKIYQNRIKNYS